MFRMLSNYEVRFVSATGCVGGVGPPITSIKLFESATVFVVVTPVSSKLIGAGS